MLVVKSAVEEAHVQQRTTNPPVDVSLDTYSPTTDALTLMNARTVLVSQQLSVSTLLVPISVSALQVLYQINLEDVSHQTSVSHMLTAQVLQSALMANVKILVMCLDHVGLMPSVLLPIISQDASVLQEQVVTHLFVVSSMNVSATMIVLEREPVLETNVLMSAVYPMYVARTPIAGLSIMLPDASVCLVSLESPPWDVLSFNSVPMKNNVQVECCAALEFVLHHVNHHVTVLTTSFAMVEVVSANVQMTPNVLLSTAVRIVSVSRNLDVPMMLTVGTQTPVLDVKVGCLNVRMPVLDLSSVVEMLNVQQEVIKQSAPALMDSLVIQMMRKLVVKRSNVL